jgi:competence protein ComEC
MPTTYLACSWLLGVLLGIASDLHPAWVLTALVPLASSPFFPRRRLFVLGGFCVIVFFAGLTFSRFSQAPGHEGSLHTYNNNGTVKIDGYVSSDPEPGLESAQIRLTATDITIGTEQRRVSGMVLVVVPRYPGFRYGDILTVTGELNGEPDRTAATSSESTHWNYLANQDILSTMFYPDVQRTSGFRGWRPIGWLYASRSNLMGALERVLPEPQAALAQGMALGIRANIPAGLKTDFVRTGTTHLLAISGVNLTIVAGMLVTLTVFLFGRRHYVHIWTTLAVVWLYTWLTGLGPPVVRAAIMVSIFMAAELFGRQKSAFIALLLAAAAMTGLKPSVLFDVSFQLSFAAMAGLVFVLPLLEPIGERAVGHIPEGRFRSACLSVAGSLEVSLAAVVATWPLTAHYFGVISWVGPVATLLAMPSLPAIIITSFAAAALGLALLPLGQAVAWLAWAPLSYFMVVVAGFGTVSGASSHVDAISTPAVAGYYSAIAIMILSYHRRAQLLSALGKIALAISKFPAKWVIPSLGASAVLVWLALVSMPDDSLHVDFLDVGQGDAVLIERGTRQILIDGGPDPGPVIVEMSKKMAFWDRTIDVVVLTHPDADHLGGLVEVMRRYHVRNIVTTNVTIDSPLFKEWQALIQSKKVHICSATAGQTITLGPEVSLSVLGPDQSAISDSSSSLNDMSIVTRLSMGNVSFLLAGDLPTEGEEGLITERAHLRSTVLKVAHHGSASSTSQTFLNVVDPQVVVVSVGKDNSYAHPNKDVMARLEERVGSENIYRTDEKGTVEFITNGERLWVKTSR